MLFKIKLFSLCSIGRAMGWKMRYSWKKELIHYRFALNKLSPRKSQPGDQNINFKPCFVKKYPMKNVKSICLSPSPCSTCVHTHVKNKLYQLSKSNILKSSLNVNYIFQFHTKWSESFKLWSYNIKQRQLYMLEFF